MDKCFHCLQDGVIWDCDYMFDEVGYEGEGFVHRLHCTKCGAEIEYMIRTDEEREAEDDT